MIHGQNHIKFIKWNGGFNEWHVITADTEDCYSADVIRLFLSPSLSLLFRAPLCPSSGAQEYYTVVAACGISCCGYQFVGLVWSWGLCDRLCRMLQHPVLLWQVNQDGENLKSACCQDRPLFKLMMSPQGQGQSSAKQRYPTRYLINPCGKAVSCHSRVPIVLCIYTFRGKNTKLRPQMFSVYTHWHGRQFLHNLPRCLNTSRYFITHYYEGNSISKLQIVI